jgi:hypothetical protein
MVAYLVLENFLPVRNFVLLWLQKSLYFPPFTGGIAIALYQLGNPKGGQHENKSFIIGCCRHWAFGCSARGLLA